MKKVLISGIYGQDGSYLAEKFFYNNFEVFGIPNRINSKNANKNRKILNNKKIIIKIKKINLTDETILYKNLRIINPDVIIHLAAVQSSSQDKSTNDFTTLNFNYISTLNLINFIKDNPKIKFINASSCLIYDNIKTFPQNENTKKDTSSAYGLSKKLSHELVVFMRKKYKLKFSNVILYNHESVRRPENFLSIKVINDLIQIKNKKKQKLILGNLNSYKDWLDARDTTEAIYLLALSKHNDDFIISSGNKKTVYDFVKVVANILKIKNVKKLIKINKNIIKSNKTKAVLVGNSNKIKKKLNWRPKISFEKMIKDIIDAKINEV